MYFFLIFFPNLHKDSVNPTFYIIACVHPLGMLLPKVRNTHRLGAFPANQQTSLLPMSDVVGVVGAVLQVCLAPSVDPQLQTCSCSFSMSLRRGLQSGSGRCCNEVNPQASPAPASPWEHSEWGKCHGLSPCLQCIPLCFTSFTRLYQPQFQTYFPLLRVDHCL